MLNASFEHFVSSRSPPPSVRSNLIASLLIKFLIDRIDLENSSCTSKVHFIFIYVKSTGIQGVFSIVDEQVVTDKNTSHNQAT